MDGIKVNSVELRNAAASLRKYVTQMREALDDATTNINNTSSSWESESAENLRNRYTSLSGNFQDFYDAVTKYAQFLDNTATSYEQAEKTIEQNANEVLNSGYNA